eukprot:TRINITY_DN67733_c0_g1_i1.p1 TRINITY_DN67733_c0_g1~~TRINITY_DN67733_c0_g1_i1.p1  ORF type:complete len:196 (-),score=24.14 TRINITY_DN67733_c0_g1_i1:75-662(-)
MLCAAWDVADERFRNASLGPSPSRIRYPRLKSKYAADAREPEDDRQACFRISSTYLIAPSDDMLETLLRRLQTLPRVKRLREIARLPEAVQQALGAYQDKQSRQQLRHVASTDAFAPLSAREARSSSRPLRPSTPSWAARQLASMDQERRRPRSANAGHADLVPNRTMHHRLPLQSGWHTGKTGWHFTANPRLPS